MSNTNIVCAIHFSNTSSKSCHPIITDVNDYSEDFNDEHNVADGSINELISGSLFNNNKNILQICKDFSGLKKTYYFCRGCESLERFYSGNEKPEDFDSTNKISGTFDNCISAQYSFGYNDKIHEIDLHFPKCYNFQGNYQYSNCLTNATLDCPYAINMIADFVGCENLSSISFTAPLNFLISGKQLFEGCSSLKSFNYPMKSLLSGVNMFKDCKLDIDSVITILQNLPKIINNDGVRLNDYSLSDESVNENLQLIDTSNIWTNGLYVNEDESTDNTIMKNLHRNKAKSSFVYYIYSEDNEGQTTWVENTIHFTEFGIIDLGVDDTTKVMIDERIKHEYINNSINSAINKGWKITYNDKPIK